MYKGVGKMFLQQDRGEVLRDHGKREGVLGEELVGLGKKVSRSLISFWGLSVIRCGTVRSGLAGVGELFCETSTLRPSLVLCIKILAKSA